jgi:hypothetical protein
MSKIQIQKVDHVAEAPKAPRHKSMRTYPHGVMKGTRSKRGGNEPILGVKDPAKSPPVRKGTLKILTENGARIRRKTIKQKVQSMSDAGARETLKRSGISVNPKAPPALVKEILAGGMEAGMIVVK